MSGFYRFPALSNLGERMNEEQINAVRGECIEADKALWEYEMGLRLCKPASAERIAYGMELMDVIHAAETALRMEFDDAEVNCLRDAVEDKNRKRGYY